MSIFSELESVFKNESMLSTEYLPAELPHREGEIRQLAHNIMPASRGKQPQNTFLYGPPGVGKTAVVKYVFREFENYSDRVRCVYINCWDFKSATAVLSELAYQIGAFVQRHGWSKDEVIKRFVETVKKSKKAIVVCLDEVDQLRMEALYDLVRINQYIQTPVGIVFVSNNPHVFVNVEPRIKSSLAIEEIEFRAYTLLEMKDILQKRAREAFHSIDSAVVTLCANEAVRMGGDVRVGLQCLLKAGREAEKDGAKRVSVKHVKRILRKVKPAKPELLKERITETERIILKILGNKEWKSGELYRAYKKEAEKKGKPVSDRAFRMYINHLAEIGLVKIAPKRVGPHRIISKA